MKIEPIRTEKDLKKALLRIDKIIDSKPGGKEYDELEILSTLVEAYEGKHHPIDPPDPIQAILFRMEQQELKQADLAPLMGGANRVSEVLSKKRKLSLKMIRNLHSKLRIPFESLMAPAK